MTTHLMNLSSLRDTGSSGCRRDTGSLPAIPAILRDTISSLIAMSHPPLLPAILAAAGTRAPAAAPPCDDVSAMTTPCISYLTNKDAAPGEGCCDGVRGLRNVAKTHDERAGVCQCLKSTLRSYPGVDGHLAVEFPRLCGVPLSFTLPSSDID